MADRNRFNEILKGIREKTFQISDENRDEIRLLILDAAWGKFIGEPIAREHNRALMAEGKFMQVVPLLPTTSSEAEATRQEKPLWHRAMEGKAAHRKEPGA